MFARPRHYILRDHQVVPVDDALEWAQWFEAASLEERRVAFTDLPMGLSVSTVFLGIDYNFHLDGPPLVFESMAFGPPTKSEAFPPELRMDRYSTWDEAVAGHWAMVNEISRRLVANDK
jgi:hypothetical protein